MFGFSETQILGWLTPLLWPMLRTLALLQALPVFSQRAVPQRVKVGFALFVALAAQPSLPAFPVIALDSPTAFLLVAQQVLVGLTMGFAARVLIAGVEMAGELSGLQMGLNFAGFFDPITASQGTASARLMGTMASLLFVVLGGHLALIGAVVGSFQLFKVGDQPFAVLTQLQPQHWGSELFLLGVWIALPLLGMLLFVNLVLGVIARVAPQLSIFAVGFPITLSVGLVGLLLSLPLLETPFMSAFERLMSGFR